MNKVIIVTFTVNEQESPKLFATSPEQLRYYFEKGYFVLGDTYNKAEGEDVLTPLQISVVEN